MNNIYIYYVHTCMHVRTQAHVCVCISKCVRVFMCVCVYISRFTVIWILSIKYCVTGV